MYIIDMTQEEIKEYNERSRKEFEMSGKGVSVGFVVPLLLFFGGMITPFLTKDFFVLALSLVPFYVYVFVVFSVFSGELSKNVLSSLFLTTVFGFISLGLSILFGRFDGSLGTSIGMMEVNSFISIPIGVVMFFTHRFEGCVPWPYYYFVGSRTDE